MILVTGATGFFGRSLAPALVATGEPVRALVRSTSRADFLEPLGVEVVRGDLTDRDSVLQAMQGCRAVVHAGGVFRLWGEAPTFERPNVEGTAYILEAALRCNVERLVHISSVAVIGLPQAGRTIDESHPAQPADAYQRSKLDSENVVRMYHRTSGIQAIILRPGAYYGPWGRYGWNRLFFEDPLRGLLIQVHGGKRLTFPAFVPDVAAAAVAALSKGRAGEIYNICGEPLTHREANRIISRLAGIPGFRLNVPAGALVALARNMDRSAAANGREPFYPLNLAQYVFHDWNVSSAKARDELGFTPTPFEEGACQTLQWYKDQGLWKTRRELCPSS